MVLTGFSFGISERGKSICEIDGGEGKNAI